jgi:hypothetical protein
MDWFLVEFSQPGSSMHGPSLALDPEQEDRLQRYLLGFRGDASAFSGQIGRMTYLSAVVITTLGVSTGRHASLHWRRDCPGISSKLRQSLA